MKKLALAAFAIVLTTAAAAAQDGIKRTPLQKTDFPDGYTTITGLAEIQPGVSAGRHTHPGIETGYVLEGETGMSIDARSSSSCSNAPSSACCCRMTPRRWATSRSRCLESTSSSAASRSPRRSSRFRRRDFRRGW